MKLYLFILFIFFIQSSYSQDLTNTTALDFAEKMPEFNGNIKAHIHGLPCSDTSGRVVVKFIVDAKGEISHLLIAKSLMPKLDSEALQVIRELPCTWYSGRNNGKKVPVWTMLPVDFFRIFVHPDSFPEPLFDLNTFIATNLRYPQEALENGSEGRVVIKFVVDSTGQIIDPRIVMTPSHALGEEALRVINLMPQWKPAKQDGKKVSTWFVLPIAFKLG